MHSGLNKCVVCIVLHWFAACIWSRIYAVINSRHHRLCKYWFTFQRSVIWLAHAFPVRFLATKYISSPAAHCVSPASERFVLTILRAMEVTQLIIIFDLVQCEKTHAFQFIAGYQSGVRRAWHQRAFTAVHTYESNKWLANIEQENNVISFNYVWNGAFIRTKVNSDAWKQLHPIGPTVPYCVARPWIAIIFCCC